MSFSKTIQLGSAGSLTIAESSGQVTLTGSVSESVGGGEAAGVVKASAQVNLSLSAAQLANLVFELIESKSPAGVALIEKEVQMAALAALGAA